MRVTDEEWEYVKEGIHSVRDYQDDRYFLFNFLSLKFVLWTMFSKQAIANINFD